MGLKVRGGWEKEIEWVRSLTEFLIDRLIPSIHPKWHVMQNDSAYLSNLGCYAETIWLITRFGMLYGKFQSINSYL